MGGLRLPRSAPPTTVAEVPCGRLGEVILGDPEHLLVIEAIDVDPHVGDHLGCDVPVVPFHVGHPVVRRVRLPLAMAQQQNGPGRRQGVGELAPVRRAVLLVGTLRVPGTMVEFVKVPVGIGGNEALRPLTGRSVGRIDGGLVKVNDSDDVLATDRFESSTTLRPLSPCPRALHDRGVAGTGQHPAQVDDLLDVDVLALRTSEDFGFGANPDEELAFLLPFHRSDCPE